MAQRDEKLNLYLPLFNGTAGWKYNFTYRCPMAQLDEKLNIIYLCPIAQRDEKLTFTYSCSMAQRDEK